MFFLVHSYSLFLGALWLNCVALYFLSDEASAKVRGTILILGVGVSIATVPFAELDFSTFRGTFAELKWLKPSPR